MSHTRSPLVAWRPLRVALLAVAATAWLSGCGGGDGSAAQADIALADLRTRAQAVAEVSPTEAARQLMDHAERTYPALFPGHPATQSSPPFAYRYYAATDNYLGVVVDADARRARLDVYVMGPAFGQEPTRVGPLAGYIQPVPPTE